jgi:hypothetical protein
MASDSMTIAPRAAFDSDLGQVEVRANTEFLDDSTAAKVF